MSDMWVIAFGLAGVAALISANGIFVAAEFAYVGARRTRVEQLAEQGNARARVLLSSLRELDSYIATTQLGITLASIGLGWAGEPLLAGLIEPPVEAVAGPWLSETASHATGAAIAFAAITALLIIFGELAPKSLALARPERVALAVVLPIALFRAVFRPFVWAMNTAGLFVVGAIGVKPRSEIDTELDPEELELVIESSAKAGLLSTSELLMARRALRFSATQADQIMVPRTEVAAIERGAGLDAVLEVVAASPHNRYPVFEGGLDNVTGVLDAKDLILLVRSGRSDWQSLLQPAAAVPETVSVEVAVAEMRKRGTQLLVLVDEHGGTSGILTADQVLSRLLGRWLGGMEREREAIQLLSTGNMLISGLSLIRDVEDATGVDLSDEDYDTVGGFIMARLGRIPRVGDRVPEGDWEFRVTSMDGRRVERVLALKRS